MERGIESTMRSNRGYLRQAKAASPAVRFCDLTTDRLPNCAPRVDACWALPNSLDIVQRSLAGQPNCTPANATCACKPQRLQTFLETVDLTHECEQLAK